MNKFILTTFVLAVTGEHLAGLGLPRLLAYTPELCAIAASVAVVALIARNGVPKLRPAYVVVLSLLALHFLFGIIANHVQPGTVITGSRLYFRAIPFFILALLVPPNDDELRLQFFTILALAIIQLPIAIQQRMATMARETTIAKYLTTGDWTHGTLNNSGVLSLFLIAIATVVFVCTIRKHLRPVHAAFLLILLLIPTMINETKVTLVLIPISLVICAIFHNSDHRGRTLATTLIVTTAFIVIFIPVYDYFIEPRWGYGIVEFITREGRIENYLSKDAEVGTTGAVGRLDSLTLPIRTLASDPVSLILGLGLGSVTESTFGEGFSGRFFSIFGEVVGPTYSRLLWEIGLLGVFLLSALMLLILKDAAKLRYSDGAVGVLSHAWIAIMPLMVVGMFYKDLMLTPALGVVFWYYSGTLAAYASTQTTADRSTGSATPARVRVRHGGRVLLASQRMPTNSSLDRHYRDN